MKITKWLALVIGLITPIRISAAANESTALMSHNTISVDGYYFYAIYTDGTLYRFKCDERDPNKLTRVKIIDDAIEVSKNYAIKEDGTLWTWNNKDVYPTMICNNVVAVSSGSYGSALILKNDGSLWGIGNNYCGQLGNGELIEKEKTYIKNKESYKRYDVYCVPSEYESPVKIMEDVKSAKMGRTHSIVLKNDGSVWSFGDNVYGQLGDGFTSAINNEPYKVMDGVSEIFASGAASFARRNVDDMLCRWGTNYIDGMGVTYEDMYGIPTTYSIDIRYIINLPGYNLAIKDNNSLWIYGDLSEQEKFFLGFSTPRQYIEIPYKICEDVDNVAGVDGDQMYYLTCILYKNGVLSLFEFNEDYSGIEDDVYSLKKISSNIKLSSDEVSDTNFIDIDSTTDEEQKSIKLLTKARITNGVTNNEFMPNKSISRAETVTLVLRMTGKENETGECSYSDVTSGKWYYSIAGAAQKYGIIDGYEDNTFRGEETVSDLQLAVLTARTLRNEGTAIDPEKDKHITIPDNVPRWAADDIEYALKYDLITEEEAKKLSSKPMSRGEAAVILYRLYSII